MSHQPTGPEARHRTATASQAPGSGSALPRSRSQPPSASRRPPPRTPRPSAARFTPPHRSPRSRSRRRASARPRPSRPRREWQITDGVMRRGRTLSQMLRADGISARTDQPDRAGAQRPLQLPAREAGSELSAGPGSRRERRGVPLLRLADPELHRQARRRRAARFERRRRPRGALHADRRRDHLHAVSSRSPTSARTDRSRAISPTSSPGTSTSSARSARATATRSSTSGCTARSAAARPTCARAGSSPRASRTRAASTRPCTSSRATAAAATTGPTDPRSRARS